MAARITGYSVYGLRVKSTIALPELVPENGAPDARILWGQVKHYFENITSEGVRLSAIAGGTALFWNGVGACLVRNGNEILLDPLPDADPQILRLFMLHAALVVLLQQRGYLLLHASVVAINGRALVFLGESGQGKSTLAAALYHRGHTLISDDVAVIQFTTHGPVVQPCLPQLRLLPDSASALGIDPTKLLRISPWLEKRALRATQRFATQPIPVGGVFELVNGESTHLAPLLHQEAFRILIRHYNYYGLHWLQATGNQRRLLECARLIESVLFRRLFAPRDLAALPQLAYMVEEYASNE